MNDGKAKARIISGKTNRMTVPHIVQRRYFRVFSTDIYILSTSSRCSRSCLSISVESICKVYHILKLFEDRRKIEFLFEIKKGTSE